MQQPLYVALSAQVALEKRMVTLADNVANANTTGFRATEVKFHEVLANTGQANVAYVNEGEDYLSTRAGGMRNTGNQFDFAIEGDAWFQVQTPNGNMLTRDGRFSMTPNGELVNIDGYPVLDVAGAPIQLNPVAETLKAGKDGGLVQNGIRVGQIGLFTADLTQGYHRLGSLGIVPVAGIEPLVDEPNVGMMQGFLEESNVNAISEMSTLIMISRAFENASILIRDTEESLKEAIRTLGNGR
jgi:flagellar basal-body rod protein FlgF